MLRKLLSVLLALALCGCSANTDTQPTVSTLPIPTATETPTESTVPPTEETLSVFDPYAVTAEMSAEELVGQLFLARCPETETAISHVSQYHLGGYILFGKDFENETPASVTETISAYQAAAAIPLLIAVDEEGGTVTRVSTNPTFRAERFRSPRDLYAQGGMESVLQAETEKSRLLSSLGINVNMAPVCDVTTDPTAFMYRRSLGQDPQTTGQFAAETTEIMSSFGIGAVLKHFPGYGNNADTHIGIAVDNRTLDALEINDLVPFSAAIKTGSPAVLVSHTIVACLDGERPASLSPQVITYLRQSMGFDGVVVTDDLAMDAITHRYGAEEAAIMAIAAGCDLLCSSEYQVQYNAVLDAVNSGRLSRQRVIQAAARILQWKYSLGLLTVNQSVF